MIDVPVIHLGEPEGNLEDYKSNRINGVVLYYPVKLETEREEIKISLAKLLKWKKLHLEGY
ncbi:hypothetical protein [Alkaliphilus transvaalensis]|uniref:hypothetical protein n=1 Tax=Alkaliphilus transvaalensis TaxID=114628 RepID=UPI00047AD195|nr:hypothetical protein [Alkaliphilus transvaalensis]